MTTDQPTPAASPLYKGVPPLPTETPALAEPRHQIADKHLQAPDPLLRELLLRQAAYWHRTALEAPTVGTGRAYDAAWELMAYDRRHGTWLGGLGPDSRTWSDDTGALDYTHREWTHWQASDTTASD